MSGESVYNFLNSTTTMLSEYDIWGDNETEVESDAPYIGDQLYQFKQFYHPLHGYLSLLVCGFGILANTLNIIVLTR